jgi:hypothetical protein
MDILEEWGRDPEALKVRLLSRTELGPGGCWLWTRGKNQSGYGTLPLRKHTTRLAHRVSYRLFIGPIPDGMGVCHHCDVPACVNPGHLFLGDQIANMRDALAKNRIARKGPQGERHARARLTEANVREIRERLKGSYRAQSRIAREFGVCSRTVCAIANNRTWRHLA